MNSLQVITLMAACNLGYAAQIPQACPEDARVKHVAFHEHNVVTVKATTFIATQLLFGKNEQVLAVEGGDTAGWMVTYHDNLPNMVFVKPTLLNSNTNMTIVTNLHNYYLHMVSNKALTVASKEMSYTIRFTYPEDDRKKEEAIQKNKRLNNADNQQPKDPKRLNHQYRFSGNNQIMPVHVYDDGHFTYFELAPNQPVPAVFAVDDRQGKESVVNTRREGNLLVVQRLAPQFSLRNGGLVASVFNSNEIARIKQGRR